MALNLPMDGVQALVSRCGLGQVLACDALAGGTNNRTLRVEATGGAACLRWYYRGADDPRDRLGAEYGFVSFAWDAGVRSVPRPLGAAPEHGMALYELIDGRRLEPGAITRARVDEAADFVAAVNAQRGDPRAARLAAASEACFSLSAHLALVRRRVERLTGALAGTDDDAACAAFVRDALVPRWAEVEATARAAAARLELEPDAELAPSERRLSPSDFGFHNALVDAADRVRFIDFEYAGWDDPAKLANDFFSAPAVPVPHAHYDAFVTRLFADAAEPARAAARAALLLPVYQVKWVCILLNDFLPSGRQRRGFARVDLEPGRRGRQLQRASAALARVI